MFYLISYFLRKQVHYFVCQIIINFDATSTFLRILIYTWHIWFEIKLVIVKVKLYMCGMQSSLVTLS